MKYILLPIFLLVSTFLFSQFTISGKIQDYNNKSVLIKTANGTKFDLISKVYTKNDGTFSYDFKTSLKDALIVLYFESRGVLELIADNSDIVFESKLNGQEIIDLVIVESNVNRAYIEYTKYLSQKSLKETFAKIKNLYFSSDTFHKAITKEEKRVNSFKMDDVKYPFLVNYMNLKEVLSTRPTKDILLNKIIYSSDFIEKNGLLMGFVAAYLGESVKNVSSKEEAALILNVAVADLIDKVGVETNRGQYVLLAVVKLLDNNGMRDLSNEWMKKASDLTCKKNDQMQNAIDAFVNIKNGKVAPNFIIKDNEKYKSLYDIKTKKKLLIFWASWCPHCTKEMPFVREFYDDFKKQGGEIITISADINKNKYEAALKKYDMNVWVNHTDLLKWDSPVFKEYNIKFTPQLFLLDEDNKIIKTSSKISEIREVLLD